MSVCCYQFSLCIGFTDTTQNSTVKIHLTDMNTRWFIPAYIHWPTYMWYARQLSLIWSCCIGTHSHTETPLLVGCHLTLFVRLRGFFPIEPSWPYHPSLIPLPPTKFHCHTTLSVIVYFQFFCKSTLDFSLAHKWQVENGCSSQLTPSHLPLSSPRLSSFCVCLRKCIVCPSAPLISPFLHKLHCLASKSQQQMGGRAVTQEPAERWQDCVLVRIWEVFVCGEKSAIFRCANISSGTAFLFQYMHACTYVCSFLRLCQLDIREAIMKSLKI